jgi:hypothetical protein
MAQPQQTWRDKITVSQDSMGLDDDGVVTRTPPPPICGNRRGGIGVSCTRTAGHDGDHQYSTYRLARIATWPQD